MPASSTNKSISLSVVLKNTAAWVRPKVSNSEFKKLTYQFYTFIAFTFLVVATLYVGIRVNLVYSNIQDATVYPYLFQHFQLHDIVLPGQHPNILKFPLFWLQSVIPYNYDSFTLVNMSLLFSTVFGWCFLVAYIFGKRCLPLIFIIMAAILLGSSSLGFNLIETTIRNIEYPIGLSFVIVIGELIKGNRLNRRTLWAYVIILLLFTLSLAGDSFMLYAFVLPVLIIMAVDWLRTDKFSRSSTLTLGIVIATSLSGIIIRHMIEIVGIVSFYVDKGMRANIIPIDGLGPSLANATSQIPNLIGANVFGQNVMSKNTLYFINFILLVVGLLGLVTILLWVMGLRSQKPIDKQFDRFSFALGVIAVSALSTFGSYVFSGLAVIRLPSGVFIDSSNIRYLTLIPFLLVPCIVFIITLYDGHRRHLKHVAAALILVGTIISIPSIKESTEGLTNFTSVSQANIHASITTLDANNITQIVAGDAIAAPIRFWSQDKIKFASLSNCDKYMHQNTRLSWRKPSSTIFRSALIIDRVGADRAYTGLCSDEQFRTIYGVPNKIIIPAQYEARPTSFEIWIYDHDIRNQLSNK